MTSRSTLPAASIQMRKETPKSHCGHWQSSSERRETAMAIQSRPARHSSAVCHIMSSRASSGQRHLRGLNLRARKKSERASS